ncbi:hypothetical protein [Actinocrispum wychmicini]|uniref:Uncharacterized protein n=1 Tax=Actinocrispum wychmicini TaxID=1213861 RepID=A0A4R2K3F5_9PSEU|nr:hypothetical protein [Actinocrispum wychmicini]TCO64326.1 hypothetical protein EV192_10193 [Actinocrispum wychmicini]
MRLSGKIHPLSLDRVACGGGDHGASHVPAETDHVLRHHQDIGQKVLTQTLRNLERDCVLTVRSNYDIRVAVNTNG